MNSKNNVVSVNRFPVRYEEQRAVIRFTGQVCNDTIFNLCDELDSAAKEYFYRDITIEIDSPGGELRSLLYYTSKLKEWRKQGLRIETLAMTNCCSAAAFMLSFGDLGRRRAMPNASLLYHSARILGSNEPLTADRLDRLSVELNKVDSRLLIELVAHLHPWLDTGSLDFMREFACSLPAGDTSFDGKLLRRLRNPAAHELISHMEQARKPEDIVALKSELHRCFKKILEQKGKLPQVTGDAAALQERLAQMAPARREQLTITWLYQRLEHLRRLFSRDEYIEPGKAIHEQLIDQIKE